ncbi:MAG: histidine triad nucleotide-binding protein [Candidatus Spechtbacterales bacterium]
MADIFCRIIQGEVAGEFLFEDDDLVVLKDIAPKAPVHYLVIPKKHISTINDVAEEDSELLGKMVLAAKRTAKEKGIEEGYKLVYNVGERGGQEVLHIHLHVLGGWKEQ